MNWFALHACTRECHKLLCAMQPSFAEDVAAAGGVALLIGLLQRSSDPRLHAAAAAGLLSIALGVADAPAAIAAADGVKARAQGSIHIEQRSWTDVAGATAGQTPRCK